MDPVEQQGVGAQDVASPGGIKRSTFFPSGVLQCHFQVVHIVFQGLADSLTQPLFSDMNSMNRK